VVSNVVGYLKEKSAISIAKNFRGWQRNFNGGNFGAHGYFVSTVGLDKSSYNPNVSFIFKLCN
jgi:putative transposase